MNRCAHCSRKICDEPALLARGQLWHLEHFFCSVCGCRIQEGEKFEEKAELSVCGHCHLDVVPCAGCLSPIEDKFVQIGEKHFHPTCFSCAVCRQPLEGSFVEHGTDLPMHRKCYWEYQLVMHIADKK